MAELIRQSKRIEGGIQMKNNQLIKLPILILVLSLASFIFVAQPSAAVSVTDSQLSYKGTSTDGQAEFELQSADLLEAFKAIMPGDKVTQKLTIKNESSKATTISLAIVATDPLDLAFLEQLSLTLTASGKELYKGQIEEITKTNGLELGEFAVNQTRDYYLVLEVPLELDNQYNGYQTISEWTFLAIDSQKEPPVKPKPPVDPEPPVEPEPPTKPREPVTSQVATKNKSVSRGPLLQTNERSESGYLLVGILLVLGSSYLGYNKLNKSIK